MSYASLIAGIDEVAESTARERNEDTGLVYRGACDLVHIEDGKRAEMGERLATALERWMRGDAVESGARTYEQVYGAPGEDGQPLCPGCYMVAIFNAAVALAKANGQSLSELGNSMAQAFQALADGGESRIESIHVALDPDDDDGNAAPQAMQWHAPKFPETMFATLAHMVGLGGAL